LETIAPYTKHAHKKTRKQKKTPRRLFLQSNNHHVVVFPRATLKKIRQTKNVFVFVGRGVVCARGGGGVHRHNFDVPRKHLLQRRLWRMRLAGKLRRHNRPRVPTEAHAGEPDSGNGRNRPSI
jgi:hypothetical protein